MAFASCHYRKKIARQNNFNIIRGHGHQLVEAIELFLKTCLDLEHEVVVS